MVRKKAQLQRGNTTTVNVDKNKTYLNGVFNSANVLNKKIE